MAKKTTLKHSINGNIVTRTTAREYTHVLVGRDNPEKLRATLAREEKRFAEERLPKVIADAEYDFKYYSKLAAVPVGEKFFYHRNQGGAYMNRSGKHMEVADYQNKSANEIIKDGLDGLLKRRIDEARENFADYKARMQSRIDNEDQWEVISWHGRQDLAEKAAGNSRYGSMDLRVDPINNGIED